MFWLHRKIVLYSSTKFGILKPWTNIQSLRRFCWGFWQTSNIKRKLIKNIKSNIKRKLFRSFEFCLSFPEKFFYIRRANLTLQTPKPICNHTENSIEAFDRVQNKFIGNSNVERKLLRSSKACVPSSQKWFWIRRPTMAF